MWVKISDREKCMFLRNRSSNLYTVPDAIKLEHSPILRSEADITFYDRSSDEPQILIKRGWNDAGLWEETYYKWEVENESTSS